MDKVDAMRLFVRIVERRSFTLAAQDLDLPRSTVTEVVKRLEGRLGVRLLERTTRHVRPSLDGEAYYQRCVSILAEIEEAEAAFTGAQPEGLLRVDVQGVLARHFMLPGLPGFLARYPQLQLRIGESDRYVDLVREGVDCVLRVGRPTDSSMVGRQIAQLTEGTYASPAYVQAHGRPASPDALDGHRMVAFVSSASGGVLPLEFQGQGQLQQRLLPQLVSVTGTEMYVACARLGLGLIQVPSYRVQDDLASGQLVEILPDYPPTPSPVYVLYPQSRQLSPRVRVFVDWLSAEFAARLPSLP